MKIVIISNLFPPHVRGGAELVAAEMARAFFALGHEVVVITTTRPKIGPQKYALDRALFEGIPVLRFFPMNLYFTLDDFKYSWTTRLAWHIRDTFNFYSAGVVRKILKKEKPDLVVTHNLKGLGMLIPGVIKELGLRHLHVLHDVQLLEPSGLIEASEQPNILKNVGRLISSGLMRLLFGSPKFVVSPSQWLLDYYAKRQFFPNSQKIVMPNPSLKLSDIPKTASHGQNPKFVFLGQVEKHKGAETLFHAFKDACEFGSFQAELDYVGDGRLLKDLKSMSGLNSRVHFHGRLPREKALKILSEATALVFPSECLENSPGSVQEALALGIPVIATDVGGVPELVRENQTGWLVPPGDIPALARMLRHVAAHPKELEFIKSCLIDREYISAEEYCQRILALLR
ncbi:MAG: glycosyltransferase [bacterium]